MKKIYCFVEEQGEKTEEFLQCWDEEDIVELFTNVVESCEGKIFFALAQIISLLLQEEKPVVFATDIEELYDIVTELYTPYFEKTVYLDTGIQDVFEEKLNVVELLDFEEKFLAGAETGLLLHRYRNLSETSDLQKIYDLAVKIYDDHEEKGWISKAFWAQICRIYNRLTEFESYQASESFQMLNLSMQMKLEEDVACTNRYLKRVWESETYGADEYYFVWNQFKDISLRHLAVMDRKSTDLLDQMYNKAWQTYLSQLQKGLSVIPKAKRKRERVLVLTIQYLLPGHAPTNTVTERCKTLLEMGKEVYLINTTEQYTVRGCIPLFGVGLGKVRQEYYNKEEIQIGEFSVPFLQLPKYLPIEKCAAIVASVIREFKPWYILSIGTGSMIADLCGRMVPCASMALAFSTLPHTKNEMKLLGRQLSQEEKSQKGMESVIEGRFTFELKKQKVHFTRREMSLPDDKFLLLVVGIRLDYEVTEEFLHMLENIFEKQIECFVVFAGIYNGFFNMLENHPKLEGHVHFIGYCDDIPALMEICDLYVNPKRLGGGFSVIEAFAQGVPGVYLPVGDVYTAGGEEFAAADFEEMEEQIIRYQNDSQYYQKMSAQAKERAVLMTSAMEAMREIDTKICDIIEKEC